MPYLDSLRLDKLYKMEEGFFSRDLSKNPKDIVIRIMNNDINRKILRFEGIKNFQRKKNSKTDHNQKSGKKEFLKSLKKSDEESVKMGQY